MVKGQNLNSDFLPVLQEMKEEVLKLCIMYFWVPEPVQLNSWKLL